MVLYNESDEVIIKSAGKTARIDSTSEIMRFENAEVPIDRDESGGVLVPLRDTAENIFGKKVSYHDGIIYISESEAMLDSSLAANF